MSGGTCPFASLWQRAQPQTTAFSTCPLGFGSSSPSPATSSSSPSSAAPTTSPVTCPLGFGGGNKGPTAAAFAKSGLPRMPLAVLAGHNTLVSVKGVVFDVADHESYHETTGGKLAGWVGHDASRLIAVSEGAEGDSGGSDSRGRLDAGLEGLRYEEHQRLEDYFIEMARSRPAVAVLSDEDYISIFGTPLVPATDIEVTSSPTRSMAMVTELHASVEQGDAEAVARVLSRHQQHKADGSADGEYAKNKEAFLLVDSACPRTGMAPLLKAVERGSEEVTQVLLDAGADVRSQAALYDGDTALDLAKRLGCSDAIVDMLQKASNTL